MPRYSSRFVCQSCGYQSSRWMGKCPQCAEWNTLIEEIEQSSRSGPGKLTEGEKPVVLSKTPISETPRYTSGIKEFDKVLGGGMVPGSIILLAGEPGIGKSTLLLSVSQNVAATRGTVLYVSGEESQAQVGLRAQRLHVTSDNLYFMAERDVDAVISRSKEINPGLLIVDSIQACEDSSAEALPGGPTQVKTCAIKFQQYAKAQGVTVVLVGHAVKSGGIAGPRLLEHLVDTVLYFEGDTNHMYRLVRAQKNRFGPTNELSVFQMEEKGLIEVVNPSEVFLSERNPEHFGSCVASCLKGNQPVCVEVQALVSTCIYGTPRRITSEIDSQRAALIMAVLSKKMGMGIDNRDAFIKIAGGIRIDEPGVDLACAMALVSSYYEKPVKPDLVCFGEIGLSGEVRMVSRMRERVREAARVGFKKMLVPVSYARQYRDSKVIGVSSVEDAVRNALDNQKSK